MAMTNWTRSDASTPHSPAMAENTMQMRPQTMTVWKPAPAEHDVGDLDRSQSHRRHDGAVEEETQIDRPETAHEGRRSARVAKLVELEVGEDAGTPPHPGVEKHRQHAGEQKGPPRPVRRDTVGAHEVSHQIRGVGGKGRGHHGGADQATTAPTARRRRIRRCPCSARRARKERGCEGRGQTDDDDDPVDRQRAACSVAPRRTDGSPPG